WLLLSLYSLCQRTDTRLLFFFVGFFLSSARPPVPASFPSTRRHGSYHRTLVFSSLRSHRLPTSTRASLSEGLRKRASRSDASSGESRSSSAGWFKAGFQHSSSPSSS